MKNKKENLVISVVVPFYNAEKTLKSCLEALAAQTVKPCEIIMVDNGSTDASADIADKFVEKEPEIFKYVLENRRGPSIARNSGAKQSQGDIISFTDSDCIPDKNWLRNILIGFNDSQIGSVAGKIKSYRTKNLYDKFHAVFTLKGFTESYTLSEFSLVRGGFPTANLSVRRDAFNKIGGFDETLKISAEDYDLCARIYQIGCSIKYLPDVIVYHQHRNTLRGTWRQSFGFGTGHPKLLKKHFKRLTIIDLPKFQYISKWLPFRIWFDAAGADKKLLLIIIIFIMWPPAIILVPLFFFYLFFNICSHLKKDKIQAKFIEKLQLIFLLFVKSIALTAGRIKGSIQNRVICI
jgi:GT2 family glycosyltransferase